MSDRIILIQYKHLNMVEHYFAIGENYFDMVQKYLDMITKLLRYFTKLYGDAYLIWDRIMLTWNKIIWIMKRNLVEGLMSLELDPISHCYSIR